MLYYQQYGIEHPSEKPSLVLLHGWGMHSGIWQTLIPELERHYQLTVIDLPGLGQSAECRPAVYDIDSITTLVAAVAPKSAIWLGWSLGGIIAMSFAQRFPERVSRIITLGTSPCFIARDDWPFGMAATTYDQFEVNLKANSGKTLQRFNRLQVQGSGTARADLKILQQIVADAQPTDQSLSDSLTLLRQDYRELYRRLPLPTLHLLCELDTLAPAAMAEALSTLQTQTQVAVLPGQSHVGFLSAPACMAETIRTFCG
ncbi:pimeloyl-ACP methyl ester esterase BioH [Amphritea sp. 1_MG-2023]|uniref:pimeloyl-ACP methyl ester esterase BioH n=1 Tax=Amphritea sp. 1_MG-2023 TaxID=3062670 RepID=UPI0026E41D24|nr:pimeloyl-ACP methyl ester esterase BioH [Amphritea sp. 1_MG-2023]MDO6562829.1 pimeloyl-ACP methyl ester esterase BioH [Amphritea sp. 1_MG-2023]